MMKKSESGRRGRRVRSRREHRGSEEERKEGRGMNLDVKGVKEIRDKMEGV